MTDINWQGPFIPLQGSDLLALDLTSQVDGVTSTFVTTVAFQTNRIFVFWNGLFQGPPGGIEVTVNSNYSFSLSTAPLVGDKIFIIYSPLYK